MDSDLDGGPIRESNFLLRRLNTLLDDALRQGFVELEIEVNNDFLRKYVTESVKVRIKLPAES
jgi:hypothetical protein